MREAANLSRIRRRCACPNTIMWSRHSRRIVPISLSTYGFCHGDRGAVGLSRMPMARNRCNVGHGLNALIECLIKRLRKKARKGLRGWPIATIAFYGPNLSQATKVTVGIVPSENAEVEELRDWKVDYGDIRADPGIAREILEFIEKHRVLSVAMTDGVIGCPHQEGVDYEGEWCPVCEFWHGRDRFTGHRVH